MPYEWVDDKPDKPPGVGRLGSTQPEDGKQYFMYYGTTKENAEAIAALGFQQPADGMLGRGVYLRGDMHRATLHPAEVPESDRAVIKVVVDVGKVIAIDRQDHPYQKTWHNKGYDTAWVPPNEGMVMIGLEENCVWDPDQIQITKIINPTPI